jgi:hypothetical protein
MRRFLVLGFLLVFSGASALAQDVVRVKYIPSYPLPDTSMETVGIQIERTPSGSGNGDAAIDRYFSAVSAILAEEKVKPKWERAIPDAPFVRVEITVGGRSFTFGSSYSENGLDTFGPDDSDQRHRRALEGILKLTLQRVTEKSPVK